MVEKFKAIRDSYKALERDYEEKLAKVRGRISLFDEMIAEEGGLATATAKVEKPSEQPVQPVQPVLFEENRSVVAEKKESEIIEIHL